MAVITNLKNIVEQVVSVSPELKGEQGIQGIQGIQGEQGIQGLQGIQGEQGTQGIQGEQGLNGDKGETGEYITGIPKVSGNGLGGTTDTYAVETTGGTIGTFEVYNGRDGEGIEATTIKSQYESNPDTNVFTDNEKTKLSGLEISSQLDTRDTNNRNRDNHTGTQSLDTLIETASLKIMTGNERTKLGAIEANATADQTDLEIESLYEGLGDTNKFTDSEKAKLATVESGATGDLTGSEIKVLYEGISNTNAFTDTDLTMLDSGVTLNTGANTATTAINELHSRLDVLESSFDDITNKIEW